MTGKLVFCGMILSLFAILNTTQIFAISDEEIRATEKIKNNPTMMQILKKIEQSKKILAEMQEGKMPAQQNKALQEARAVANAKLNAELDSMNKDNEQFTPQSAFSKFVSKKPASVQDIYVSMFNYQQDKIKFAQNIREQTMASGGNTKDAWNAYYKNSATSRVQMISLAKDLNAKYANADAKLQRVFDSNGKIPRTD